MSDIERYIEKRKNKIRILLTIMSPVIGPLNLVSYFVKHESVPG